MHLVRVRHSKRITAAALALLAFVVIALFYAKRIVLHNGLTVDTQSSGEPPAADATFLTLLETSLSKLTPEQLEVMYYAIVEHRQVHCSDSMRIGGAEDGGWNVCFSGEFDIRQAVASCVAFSFGINYGYGYDDALSDTYKCRVHMFDPSMSNVSDHQRRNTSWFHKVGLSSNNSVTADGWKMRTLCTLFSQLGYADSNIDILKIDIEHWEWESFEMALQEGCLTRVKQLLFESHTGEIVGQRTDHYRLIRVWLGLFRAGFRTWKWHRNRFSIFFQSRGGVRRACCYEHYMLNTRFAA